MNVADPPDNVKRPRRPKFGLNAICVELCSVQAQWKNAVPALAHRIPPQDRMRGRSVENMHKCAQKAQLLHPIFRVTTTASTVYERNAYTPTPFHARTWMAILHFFAKTA
jgi:hypothetical protein